MQRTTWLAAGLAAVAALAACSSATGGAGDSAGAPAPAKGGATSGRGSAILYRAGSTRYAIQRRDSLVLQFPGGQSQTQLFDRTMYLTVGLTEAAGDSGYHAAIVLDSIRAAESGLVTRDSLARAEGTRWTATLSRAGRLSGLAADRTSAIGEQVGGTLQTMLFPVLPAGGARDGASWTDTTSGRLRTAAFEMQERATVRYRAAAATTETPAGTQRGLAIESEASFTQSGTGSQFGQQMQMQGSGSRHVAYRLGQDGIIHGAEGADSGSMTIAIPAVGQSVPVTQVGRFTVTAPTVPQAAR